MKVNRRNIYVFCALFAALTAVSNFFIIPIAGFVPIVLKNMFVVLAGTVLGGFYGGIALFIFIMAGLIGIPVFVIPGGFGVFATSLAGYITGYFFGSLAAGLIAGAPSVGERKPRPVTIIRVCLGSFLGFALILFCGAVYMKFLNKMSFGAALAAGVMPFLIGDAIKLVISIPLALALRPIAAKYIGTRDEGQGTRINVQESAQLSNLKPIPCSPLSTPKPCPLSPFPFPIIITLNNITKYFLVYENNKENRFYALDDVSFEIKKGERAIIAGANGSGKSLLMSIIAGLEEPSSGTVQIGARVGLVFQEPDAQILGETPLEDAAFGPRNMGLSKREANARAQKALASVGLLEKQGFPARPLSGGEKRRLAAAGVLAMDAEIIIFDEPYANMDYPGVLQINRLIKELSESGKTILILTHELEKCMEFADRFIVLCKGKKVFDGNFEDAINNLEEWGIHNPNNLF